MTNTIETTRTVETAETQKTEMTKTEICFGAMMAIGAIAGMWGAVSLLISYFMG